MSPSTAARIASLTMAIAACLIGNANAQTRHASWLDAAKPAPWNKPSASIPTAPKAPGAVNSRCRTSARAAELEEDTRLRDQGWNLVGAYQRDGQVLVIRATASYDGMCRPRMYQGFVFARGVFVGTLSPDTMDSRSDGALGEVVLKNQKQLSADYARYAADDPLCCPSRTTRVDFEIAADTPALRPVGTSTSSTHVGTTGNRASTARVPSTASLEGTSWQLVKFQGSDDKVLTPENAAKYTIEFSDGGRLAARIDCNRGPGTWTSTGGSQIQFGPLALTRAKCPPGSMHDQIAKQWSSIRSYTLKDGHLFLSLKADGGVYEFERLPK